MLIAFVSLYCRHQKSDELLNYFKKILSSSNFHSQITKINKDKPSLKLHIRLMERVFFCAYYKLSESSSIRHLTACSTTSRELWSSSLTKHRTAERRFELCEYNLMSWDLEDIQFQLYAYPVCRSSHIIWELPWNFSISRLSQISPRFWYIFSKIFTWCTCVSVGIKFTSFIVSRLLR